MDITFETAAEWDSERKGVTFWAAKDGLRVRCFVSALALATSSGSANQQDVLASYDSNRPRIYAEIAALISSGRMSKVPSAEFLEVQIHRRRVRHRPVTLPTRRVCRDELLGSTVAEHARKASWWYEAARGRVATIVAASDNDENVQFVELSFTSAAAAESFDYLMSKYGVRTVQVEPAG